MARAICMGVPTITVLSTDILLSKLSLVVDFVVMASVLIVKPRGLFGRIEPRARTPLNAVQFVPPTSTTIFLFASLVVLALVPAGSGPYFLVFLTDIFLTGVFALSLYSILGPGGMVSFGHAAYFGLGAYGAALLFKNAGWSMETSLLAAPLVAAIGGAIFGWFSVRLSGVYLAMLTLAFAQIVWSIVFQWDSLTGGSNGLVGIWPVGWLSSKYSNVLSRACTLFVHGIDVIRFEPFSLWPDGSGSQRLPTPMRDPRH